jgi:hypothetical protein
MDLRDELIAYQKRWELVEKKVQEERNNAPLELRWRQLNSAYAMGERMNLPRIDPSEKGVFEIWARLKKETP